MGTTTSTTKHANEGTNDTNVQALHSMTFGIQTLRSTDAFITFRNQYANNLIASLWNLSSETYLSRFQPDDNNDTTVEYIDDYITHYDESTQPFVLFFTELEDKTDDDRLAYIQEKFDDTISLPVVSAWIERLMELNRHASNNAIICHGSLGYDEDCTTCVLNTKQLLRVLHLCEEDPTTFLWSTEQKALLCHSLEATLKNLLYQAISNYMSIIREIQGNSIPFDSTNSSLVRKVKIPMFMKQWFNFAVSGALWLMQENRQHNNA